jgi:hypothetical protein
MKKLILILIATTTLAHAGAFGPIPTDAEEERANSLGEKFGEYLCTEWEALASKEGKSRRHLLHDARVAAMKEASRQFPNSAELRMGFYEAAVWTHEDFSNWFWRSPVAHRPNEDTRDGNAPVVFESGGTRFVIEKGDDAWVEKMKAKMKANQKEE